MIRILSETEDWILMHALSCSPDEMENLKLLNHIPMDVSFLRSKCLQGTRQDVLYRICSIANLDLPG